MRKIVTAVTAAALSLSMLAAAVPASAVTGYDSAYAGESAFVNISPGQTLNFQVFFANTGTTTWSRGTGTQVDLAACLEDKTTCNAQDATEASWNSSWLSATRYATTTQTTTAPGSLGTFSYNVTAPVGATAGTFRFNGDLVLSTTGERIHPDGYYQDATIGGGAGGAASITSLTPNTGTSAGGTNVVIAGSGFVCTPAFPAVSFGGSNAVVSSCGSTSVTAVSPAHAPGAVTVTLTNSGQAASNGLTYTYADTTAPTFTGQSTTGNFVTVTFSEPVCNPSATSTAATDWTVRNVSASAPIPGISYTSEDFVLTGGTGTPPTIIAAGSDPCSTAQTTADSSFNLTTSSTLPSDTVYTLTVTPEAGEITDIAGNNLANPSSVTFTTGAADFTPPTIVDARMANNLTTTNFGDVGDSFTLTFSEKMNGSTTGTIEAQDQDGTTMAASTVNAMTCGGNVSCTWNTAVTTLTVTVATAIATSNGTTPGM